MTPLDGDAIPWTKERALARPNRRAKRQVASRKHWAEIAAAKQGPCRGCGAAAPNQLAHLLGRGQGAPDADWNIVPLCIDCHPRFDAHDPETCKLVALSLTDEEYAGLVAWGGEGVVERRFHLTPSETDR